tara:strand:- start:85 stop:315 length:231 start_codon:yes stop_codon:yes gene_type:complete
MKLSEYYKSEIAKMNDDQLLQARANAHETCMNCIGHNKAEMNAQAFSYYSSEAKRRGINGKKANTFEGVFNGLGSL